MRITTIHTSPGKVSGLRRVAGYARVSVDTSPAESSLQTQTAYLRRRISSRPGWVDCGVFADFGFTGTKTDRPGFNALMQKCNDGKVDLIITKSIIPLRLRLYNHMKLLADF